MDKHKDRLRMMEQRLERRTPEPKESYRATVEKVVERGNQSYAILVESDQRGRPVSYVILEQPHALQASASLSKEDPKITYSLQPAHELKPGERVEVYGQRVVSGARDASQKLDGFKRELRQKERERKRELNPKRSKGRDGPDFGR
jgi:hypothetical protein